MKLLKMEIHCMCGRKWSKIAEFVLVIMLYFNALASQNIQTEFVDGIPWSFVIRNNEAELVGCLNSPVGYKESLREKLVIPEILASKKVTVIHNDVFVRSLFWHGMTRDAVRYIEVPASITNIAQKSFSYFLNLQQIEVAPSNKVYKSEKGVLYRRGQTDAIVIPYGRLSKETFQSRGSTLTRWLRASIGKAEIPKKIDCIQMRAFENCEYLESVIMPEGLKEIGEYAFSRCRRIRMMILPSSVTNVADGAFAQCSHLTHVEFPAKLQALGDCVFSGCRNLRTVVFKGPPPVMSDIVIVFTNTPNGIALYCDMNDKRWIRCLETWPGEKKPLVTK